MLRKYLTYFLSLWYALLLQMYPIVHIHWHEGNGPESCFEVVDIHADAVVQSFQCTAHCFHLHIKADFDQIYTKQNDNNKKLSLLEQVALPSAESPKQQYVQNLFCSDDQIPIDFYFTTLSNKSPPRF